MYLHTLVKPLPLEVHVQCLVLQSLGFRFPPQMKRGFSWRAVGTHLYRTPAIIELYFKVCCQNFNFFLLLPSQFLRDYIKKRGLMLALRWASIQYSSQFSYFTMRDLLFRLSTISKIGNRENIVTFKAMLIHEPIEASFLWHLPTSRRKSKKLKN